MMDRPMVAPMEQADRAGDLGGRQRRKRKRDRREREHDPSASNRK